MIEKLPTGTDFGWYWESRKSKPWVIEKERKLICFGNPGYIIQWDSIGSYETKEEAEKALDKLNSMRDPTKRERYQISDNRGLTWTVK